MSGFITPHEQLEYEQRKGLAPQRENPNRGKAKGKVLLEFFVKPHEARDSFWSWNRVKEGWNKHTMCKSRGAALRIIEQYRAHWANEDAGSPKFHRFTSVPRHAAWRIDGEEVPVA